MSHEFTPIECECGRVFGEQCAWSGPMRDTALVEWMPPYLRGSHRAAGNHGAYPANGAERLRVEASCAARIVADEPEWACIVG